MTFHIRSMTKEDISQVANIDREAFPTMWPPINFKHELTNKLAHYAVCCDKKRETKIAEEGPSRVVSNHSFLSFRWLFNTSKKEGIQSPPKSPPKTLEYVTGFTGIWLMVDEAHIINIAVKEEYRGKGLGELLLISGIDMASNLNAAVMTLEVRASNTVAQSLYLKYGFQEAGVRKGYYTDNKENALIMTTDLISTDSFKEKFKKLKEAHWRKIKNVDYQI